MEEIWKDIKGYEGLYQVSNLGRVKSLGNGKSNNSKVKILKPCKNKDGYFLITLSKNNKKKSYRINRLVASAFIPNPNNLTQVNHKDEDKTNNRVDNLEWCDSKYNTNYGTRNKRISKPIIQFTKNGEFVRKWDSATQVEKELSIKQQNISKCCGEKIKSAYNYKWGYADDYERIPFKVFDLEIYRKRKLIL